MRELRSRTGLRPYPMQDEGSQLAVCLCWGFLITIIIIIIIMITIMIIFYRPDPFFRGEEPCLFNHADLRCCC